MNMIIGKKQIVMASLVAALGLAVFANWFYADNEQQLLQDGSEVIENVSDNEDTELVGGGVSEQNSQEYFAAAKLSRTTARDEAVETLQNVIDTCDASSEAAVAAVLALTELNETILLENDVESLVIAKLGGECICSIDDSGVEVIVDGEKLNDDTVLVISDIVYANCGTIENIRITGA